MTPKIYVVTLPSGSTWKIRALTQQEAIQKADRGEGTYLGTLAQKPRIAKVSSIRAVCIAALAFIFMGCSTVESCNSLERDGFTCEEEDDETSETIEASTHSRRARSKDRSPSSRMGKRPVSKQY